MAVKRKAPRRRQAKVFSLNLLETGAALSLINQTDAAGAAGQMLRGNLKGGFDTITNNAKQNRTRILQTIAATAAAKVVSKGFRIGRIAKLGPLALRV
tara:strand:+ start:259 stop:552 length:294 start_codon:yes stop_codon:yes gene_type:complete